MTLSSKNNAANGGKGRLFGLVRGIVMALSPFLVYVVYDAYGYRTAFGVVVALLIGSRLHMLAGHKRVALTVGAQIGAIAVYSIIGFLATPHEMLIKLLSPFINTVLFISFLWSLYHPPTVIEGFARMADPNLSDEGVVYCQNVTKVWLWFFFLDTLLVLYVSFVGSMFHWMIVTGVVNYTLVGALFGGEWLYRRWRFGPNAVKITPPP